VNPTQPFFFQFLDPFLIVSSFLPVHLRKFILHSDLLWFQLALGIQSPSESQGTNKEALLHLVAQGDGKAMKKCIDQYGPLVWGIVCRRVLSRGDAEEACQEIFTEIWKKADAYDPAIAKETTFIGMIARRRSIDWQRKQSRLPALAPLETSVDLPSSPPRAGKALDRDLLWKALEKLPEKTRELFSLHFEKGMTHDEIAKQTKQPLGTVKTKLRRGLIKARELLQDFKAEEGVEA